MGRLDVAPGHPGSDPLPELILPVPSEGGEWSLDRTEAALAALGDPHERVPTIHVAGTNGKGSVSAMLASVLFRSGLRTGLYTSPHLVAFRERFVVQGKPIARSSLVRAAEQAYEAIAAQELTYFEAATVLAFQAFATEAVDVAVVEVGLGGRLDATNVVTPLVSVVTNVALDHQDYLGASVEAIAREKAGIIKVGVPVVTGSTDPRVLAVLDQVAADHGARCHHVDSPNPDEIEWRPDGSIVRLATRRWGSLSLHVPLPGAHQAHNAAIAVGCLECLPEALTPSREAVLDGVSATRWPGRFQEVLLDGRTWIFDVAHNSAGVRALVAALTNRAPPGPRVAVVGVLADKDWKDMVPLVAGVVDHMILTDPTSAPAARRWDPSAVAAALSDQMPVRVERDLEAALEHAESIARGGTVLVTGSHHTVGDALVILGLHDCEPG